MIQPVRVALPLVGEHEPLWEALQTRALPWREEPRRLAKLRPPGWVGFHRQGLALVPDELGEERVRGLVAGDQRPRRT